MGQQCFKELIYSRSSWIKKTPSKLDVYILTVLMNITLVINWYH